MNTNSNVKVFKYSIAVIVLITITALSIFAIKKFNPNPDETISQHKPLSAAEIYVKLKDSVYPVSNWDKDGQIKEYGSAVSVSDRYLVTNCHVISGGSYFTLNINNIQQRGFVYSQHNDVCLIGVNNARFKPVNIRLSGTVNIGERVYSLGNPEGLEKTFSEGIISNKYNDKGLIFLQTDAEMAPGSSGGGLFDKEGNLIGVTTKADPSERIGFVYSTELVKAALLDPEIEVPVVTNNEESVATTQTSDADVSQVPKNTEEPQLIKTFGDGIALNSDNGDCFISINGKRTSGDLSSIAIWFPDTPNGLFVFPNATSLDDVVDDFGQLQSKSKVIKSKSALEIDGKSYPLADAFNGDVKIPLLIFATDLKLTDKLLASDSFVAQFYNFNGDKGVTTVKFGITGFNDALDALHKTCGR